MLRRLFALAGLVALVWLGWMALTSLAPGSAVASWAPCPRNWAWVDAWKPRRSPLAATAIRFSRGHAKLCYGRPSLRGRQMLGGDAIPFGRLWRTGANEATTLHLDVSAKIGSIYLAPGSYSLYTVPDKKHWQLIVNRSSGQWGLESLYDTELESREVGRLSLPIETLGRAVETLTFRAVPRGGDDWWLELDWQTSRLRIPITADVEEDDELDEALPSEGEENDDGANVVDSD